MKAADKEIVGDKENANKVNANQTPLAAFYLNTR